MKLCSFTLCQYECFLQINICLKITTIVRLLTVTLLQKSILGPLTDELLITAIAKRIRSRSMVATEVASDKQRVARIPFCQTRPLSALLASL